MIEILLVIIIALICLAIYGTTYYFLKVKANSTQDCPICPDCNVSCPETYMYQRKSTISSRTTRTPLEKLI